MTVFPRSNRSLLKRIGLLVTTRPEIGGFWNSADHDKGRHPRDHPITFGNKSTSLGKTMRIAMKRRAALPSLRRLLSERLQEAERRTGRSKSFLAGPSGSYPLQNRPQASRSLPVTEKEMPRKIVVPLDNRLSIMFHWSKGSEM